MKIQVFHGSYTAVDAVDLSKCQANKDFGKGFYVTKFRHHAENWAKVIAGKLHRKGIVTEFVFNERVFVDGRFNTLRFDNYNEEWLDFVVLNRDDASTEQKHDYDIIEGPIADDKITKTIDGYLDGLISKTDFLTMLKHHENTHQICFCTVKSLQFLENKDNTQASKIIHISEPVVEQLMLDLKINEGKATDVFYSSKTFGQLADSTTKLYEKDWTEIYKLLSNELNI